MRFTCWGFSLGLLLMAYIKSIEALFWVLNPKWKIEFIWKSLKVRRLGVDAHFSSVNTYEQSKIDILATDVMCRHLKSLKVWRLGVDAHFSSVNTYEQSKIDILVTDVMYWHLKIRCRHLWTVKKLNDFKWFTLSMKTSDMLGCCIIFIINVTIAYVRFGRCDFCVYLEFWVEVYVNGYEYCS